MGLTCVVPRDVGVSVEVSPRGRTSLVLPLRGPLLPPPRVVAPCGAWATLVALIVPPSIAPRATHTAIVEATEGGVPSGPTPRPVLRLMSTALAVRRRPRCPSTPPRVVGVGARSFPKASSTTVAPQPSTR